MILTFAQTSQRTHLLHEPHVVGNVLLRTLVCVQTVDENLGLEATEYDTLDNFNFIIVTQVYTKQNTNRLVWRLAPHMFYLTFLISIYQMRLAYFIAGSDMKKVKNADKEWVQPYSTTYHVECEAHLHEVGRRAGAAHVPIVVPA